MAVRLLRILAVFTMESIYSESPWHVYTPGPPWPLAGWCVALMSAAESPQILLVLLFASFPPFVAARHVFGSTNLVNLSACDACSSEGGEVVEWRLGGRFSPSRAAGLPQDLALFLTLFFSCRKCLCPCSLRRSVPPSLQGRGVEKWGDPFNRPLLLTCQPTHRKWTLSMLHVTVAAHTHKHTQARKLTLSLCSLVWDRDLSFVGWRE